MRNGTLPKQVIKCHFVLMSGVCTCKTEKKEYNRRGIKEKEMYREMRISYVFDIFSDLGDF